MNVRLLVVGLLAGCFDPRPPAGVSCDPAAPNCPDGQRCLAQGSGFVCGGTGIADDAGTDDTPSDAPFAYVQLAAGYNIDQFQDFSSSFTFNAEDWAEATQFHDNQPDYLFAIEKPYPESIGIIAGRVIYAIDGTSLAAFDFGQHPRNTAGQADNLTAGAMIRLSSTATEPTLIVTSSSEDAGDGMFTITPTGDIATDLAANNTRSLLADGDGAFDDLGLPERYLGTQGGLIRRSDQTMIATGDIRSLHVAGINDLWMTKSVNTDTQEQLFRVASTTHALTPHAARETFRLAEGPTLTPDATAYAVVDRKQIVIVNADGSLDVIAELVDPSFIWTSVVVPPSSHSLAGKIYVLESNRGRNLDRVLAITR